VGDGVEEGPSEHVTRAIGIDGRHLVRLDDCLLVSVKHQCAFGAERYGEAVRVCLQGGAAASRVSV